MSEWFDLTPPHFWSAHARTQICILWLSESAALRAGSLCRCTTEAIPSRARASDLSKLIKGADLLISAEKIKARINKEDKKSAAWIEWKRKLKAGLLMRPGNDITLLIQLAALGNMAHKNTEMLHFHLWFEFKQATIKVHCKKIKSNIHDNNAMLFFFF